MTYPGVRGKIVDWAEHVFEEEGMLDVRVRFTDQTGLCCVLQTAQVILEADLGDWKTGGTSSNWHSTFRTKATSTSSRLESVTTPDIAWRSKSSHGWHSDDPIER